jgi:hypothetical protein
MTIKTAKVLGLAIPDVGLAPRGRGDSLITWGTSANALVRGSNWPILTWVVER